MSDKLFIRLKKLISTKLGVDETEITSKSHLQKDLNADPLSIADLIVGVEENFNIKIPNDVAAKILTVEDILNFITDQTGDL